MIKAGIPKARLCLQEIERIAAAAGGSFLAGNQLSLADLYLVPILFYVRMTPEKELLAPHKRLEAWWQTMAERPSTVKTAPNLGG